MTCFHVKKAYVNVKLLPGFLPDQKKLENSGFKDEEILTRACGEPSADVNMLTKSTTLWESTDAKRKVVTFSGAIRRILSQPFSEKCLQQNLFKAVDAVHLIPTFCVPRVIDIGNNIKLFLKQQANVKEMDYQQVWRDSFFSLM